MGSIIIDTLLIGTEDLTIITGRYPRCKVTKFTNPRHMAQQYRVRIQGEDEECYYNFLLDNRIAMSSNNFYYRVKSDRRFADRMKARIANETGSQLS
jgi:hypothetical protein